MKNLIVSSVETFLKLNFKTNTHLLSDTKQRMYMLFCVIWKLINKVFTLTKMILFCLIKEIKTPPKTGFVNIRKRSYWWYIIEHSKPICMYIVGMMKAIHPQTLINHINTSHKPIWKSKMQAMFRVWKSLIY